jgi:hypothetical protein
MGGCYLALVNRFLSHFCPMHRPFEQTLSCSMKPMRAPANALLLHPPIAVLILLMGGMAGSASGELPPLDPTLRYGGLVIWGSRGDPTLYGDFERAIPLITEKCHAAGITNVRVGLSWWNIEYQRGHYDWEETDRILHWIADHGIKNVACVATAPPWATSGPEAKEILAQRHQSNLIGVLPIEAEFWSDYERYLREAVRRYGAIIDYYEIWNEPDGMAGHRLIRDASGTVVSVEYGGDPRWYAELLRRSATIIREEDPVCAVAIGGFESKADCAPGFLEGLYEHGARRYFDAVGIHSYSNPLNRPWLCCIRAVLEAHGDAHKPFWLTEWGIGANAPHKEVKQSYLIRRRLRFIRETPWIAIANAFIANTLWADKEELALRAFRAMTEETGPRSHYVQDFDAPPEELLASWEWGIEGTPDNVILNQSVVGRSPLAENDFCLVGDALGRVLEQSFEVYVKSSDPWLRFQYRVETAEATAETYLSVKVETSNLCRYPETKLVVSGLRHKVWESCELQLVDLFPALRSEVLMTVGIVYESSSQGVKVSLDNLYVGPKEEPVVRSRS